MSRIVSVWLPRWPIRRFLAAQARRPCQDPHQEPCKEPIAPDQPFVLAVTASGGPRIAALNEAAEALGLAIGEPLADARAKAGVLQVRTADAEADDAALSRIALWATRYTPTAAPWREEDGADGFFLDIEGAAHLFGGEDKLIADLAARLDKNFGLPARLAVAATPGAAWALSRFHDAHLGVLSSGEEAAALAPLPIDALRLSGATRATLRRLGFKTIGSLLDKPRAPFASRFPAELLRRLDQALGRVDEPLKPVIAPPVYHSLRYLLEPIFTQNAVVAQASRLMQWLVHVLERDDAGARALRLSLYNVDGAVDAIDIALTLPTRNIAHVARLIDLKLETFAAARDCGFGFETIGLAVTRAEPMPAQQTEFAAIADGGRAEPCAALVDALRQRLGPSSVRRFEVRASHIPERAEVLMPIASYQSPPPARGRSPAEGRRVGVNSDVTPPRLASLADPPLSGEGEMKQPRPLLLLPRAEPAEVMALVPDGPPRRFSWRGVSHEVTGAEGPERLAGEWWRQPPPYPPPHAGEEKGGSLTRDYYLVEDSDGHRFWLYREGLYGRETAAARWFVHGLFA